KGDELMLQATNAKLHGSTIRMQADSYIGFWTDSKETASWTLNVPAPGTYAVKYLYSCAKGYGGSDVLLRVGGQSLSAQVQPTKDWEDFQLLEAGTIKLNQVGTANATVGFGKQQGKALFNLKAVIFEPISD
ncbi:MAG: hypothetical protein NWR76_04790, partial [Opitutales bacterium]|nr:hypothetical protein [Opitutales bacterium]MDP4882542.1 hypothetical protein [Opitutales bacterium]